MTQPIGAVSSPHIEHGILIDLAIPTAVTVEGLNVLGNVVTITFTDPGFEPFLPGDTITVEGIAPTAYDGSYTVLSCSNTQVSYIDSNKGTYGSGGTVKGRDRKWYISNCYNPITYSGREYKALGGFLEIGGIQQDLMTTNNEITISLSAIPPEYIENILGQQIKGGPIKLYRVFFDPDTKQVRTIDGVRQIFQRFVGIVTNWGVAEQINDSDSAVEITYTITINCSSTVGVLENRVAGRRTNNSSYQTYWAERYITSAIVDDLSMARIEQLRSASFDFGKPPK